MALWGNESTVQGCSGVVNYEGALWGSDAMAQCYGAALWGSDTEKQVYGAVMLWGGGGMG